MIKIIPAVLPGRYSDIESAIEKIAGAAATVQIDIVDGRFAPNKTWWFNAKDADVLEQFIREERGLPLWQEVDYELDLMIRDPLQHMETVLALGPSKVIFHLESFRSDEMLRYFETISEIVRSTVRFGIAISIGTPPEDIAPFTSYIDSIQCMGISNVGYQGQDFNVDAIAQVRRVRELYPDKAIAVDGGVNRASVPLLVEAGATELVVGSAIFGSNDPRGTIKELEHLCRAASQSEISN